MSFVFKNDPELWSAAVGSNQQAGSRRSRRKVRHQPVKLAAAFTRSSATALPSTKTIIRKVQETPKDTARLWAPACATGCLVDGFLLPVVNRCSYLSSNAPRYIITSVAARRFFFNF
jgi:hypothetical protein